MIESNSTLAFSGHEVKHLQVRKCQDKDWQWNLNSPVSCACTGMQPAVLQQLNFFSTGPSDLLGAQGGCTLLMRNCIVLLPPCSLCTLRLYKHFKLHFIERFWAWPCLLYSDDQYNVWENDRKIIPLYPFEDRRHDWSHHRNSARFSSEVFTGPRSWIWQLLGLQPSKHFFVWTFWLLLQLGSFPISATHILGTWIEKPNTGNSYYSLKNKKTFI